MTNDQTISVLERMRELLADPDRVVLDPMHYFEVENGTVREVTWDEAKNRRESCRVCFCGAASLATFELAATDDASSWDDDDEIRDLVAAMITALGIPLDDDVISQYGRSRVAQLTSALKQGRAVEVIDACLEDLRSVAA